jgi:hypothetical protein
MVRTQIQLTEAQAEALHRLSASTGKSIAELIRNGIDRYLSAGPPGRTSQQIERASRVVGRFSSGRSDVAEKHDRHLAEIFR